jgi:hypothetical protein
MPASVGEAFFTSPSSSPSPIELSRCDDPGPPSCAYSSSAGRTGRLCAWSAAGLSSIGAFASWTFLNLSVDFCDDLVRVHGRIILCRFRKATPPPKKLAVYASPRVKEVFQLAAELGVAPMELLRMIKGKMSPAKADCRPASLGSWTCADP